MSIKNYTNVKKNIDIIIIKYLHWRTYIKAYVCWSGTLFQRTFCSGSGAVEIWDSDLGCGCVPQWKPATAAHGRLL